MSSARRIRDNINTGSVRTVLAFAKICLLRYDNEYCNIRRTQLFVKCKMKSEANNNEMLNIFAFEGFISGGYMLRFH